MLEDRLSRGTVLERTFLGWTLNWTDWNGTFWMDLSGTVWNGLFWTDFFGDLRRTVWPRAGTDSLVVQGVPAEVFNIGR